MRYWDTSALVKLYAPEPDSPYFLNLIAQAQHPPLSSEIARAEVLCTLYRKEHAGDLKPSAAATLFARFTSDAAAGHFVLIPNGADVTAEAEKLVKQTYSQPQPLLIRSLDALHVASALTAQATTLVATDVRLRDVAVLVGLKVLP